MATQDVPPEEEAIRAAIIAGDYPHAWELLIKTYQDDVFRFCIHTLGNKDIALEITQQVMVAAGEGLRGFQGKSMRQWLLSIARHLMSRTRRGDSWYGDPSERADDTSLTPEQWLLDISQRKRLLQALSTLDPRQRAVVILAYGLEISAKLPKEEIAYVLGISRAGVYRVLHAALTCLRKELEQ